MNSGPNRFFDDFAKMMTDAAGAAQGMRREAETMFRSQAERVMNNLDLVKRDDFEAVKEMAAKARDENLMLSEKLAKLEERLEALESSKTKRTPTKKATGTKKS